MAANGFMQIIQTGSLNGQGLRTGLDTIARNMQEIISRTNDILFLQEMGLILPEFEPTDIGSVVASAVEQQRSIANKNFVGLNLFIAPDLPLVPTDPKSLERAITVILDNAIKFSPEGGNTIVEVEHEGSAIKIEIKDEGVGIPDEALPYIFNCFFHVSEIDGRLLCSIGPGLPIARQVIIQHNGTIDVESERGKGSTFTIRLVTGK